MAGVSKSVISQAREKLSELEQSSVGNMNCQNGPAQSDLFVNPTPQNDKLNQALALLEPDGLSPRQALEKLYELKNLSNQSS